MKTETLRSLGWVGWDVGNCQKLLSIVLLVHSVNMYDGLISWVSWFLRSGSRSLRTSLRHVFHPKCSIHSRLPHNVRWIVRTANNWWKVRKISCREVFRVRCSCPFSFENELVFRWPLAQDSFRKRPACQYQRKETKHSLHQKKSHTFRFLVRATIIDA